MSDNALEMSAVGASQYGAFLQLVDSKCLVVGGGTIAVRKIQGLVETGAHLVIVSPELDPRLVDVLLMGTHTHIKRCYEAHDVLGMRLVFAATNDADVNARVAQDASAQGILVNVADNPSLCSFMVPSVIARGDVSIAIGSAGQSPALTRALKQYLEPLLPIAIGALARYLSSLREQILSLHLPEHERHEWLKRLISVEMLEAWRQGDHTKLEATIQEVCNQYGLVVAPLPKAIDEYHHSKQIVE